MNQIDVFVGFDPREAVAYHVCCQSIIDNCSTPEKLAFHPVTGERRDGSNDFIYERFLIPYKMGFKGQALWMDGDMIVRGDVAELFSDPLMYQGVKVVKHSYSTKYPVKYLGNKNEDYPRKNWSSVILWNCGWYPHRNLIPETVAKLSGSYLHQFQWLADEHIGELPSEWNRLVLEQELKPEDKLRHFTIGTPCFAEYGDSPGAEEWWDTYKRAIEPLKRAQAT